MKNIKLSLLLGAVFSLCACNTKVSSVKGATLLREPTKVSEGYYSSDEDYIAFKQKFKAFANKLSESVIKSEYEDGKNIAFSPMSLEMCLGLAICASNGTTRQELLNAFDIDFETFNANYSNLYKEFNFEKQYNSGSKMFQIMMSNSIWIDDEIKLLDSGLDSLRDNYYCYSYNTDFDTDDANDAIAFFINQQTNGLIQPNLKLDPRTVFALINTLYLKDIWNAAGTDLYFSDNPEHFFTNSDKTKSSNKLLKGYYEDGRAISNDDYSSFFTYTLNGFKIYFVKPNEGKDIKTAFNKETMSYVLDSHSYVYVDEEKKEQYETRCIFPEFKAECDLDLKSTLSDNFNVKQLFDRYNCDFSNLSEEAAYCEELKQISKLEVNKKGIEGAAVTYLEAAGTAAPGQYTIVNEDFVVDKEFGFILTYRDSVVFSGVITNIDK